MFFKRLLKDSLIYGGSDLLSKALYFLVFPVIATTLPVKAFGALELILTITVLVGLVLNCGLNNAVQRYYWDKDTGSAIRAVIVTSGYSAQLTFGFIAIVLGFVCLPFILPLTLVAGWPVSSIALTAAIFIIALTQWTQYALDITRLHFAPWRFLLLTITSRVLVIMLGLIAVVYMNWGVDGFLGAQALALALSLPLALALVKKEFKFKYFDWRWAKRLVIFGYPFIFSMLGFWLFTSIDRWMLAAMKTLEDVGIYSVATRFSTIVLFVSSAFGQAWSPLAIKLRTDYPDQYRAIYANVLKMLLFVMLFVGGGVALFAGEVINFIMPAEYSASALPLVILCFGVIFQSTQLITTIGISLEKKTLILAKIVLVSAVINFVANFLLIPYFGVIGAASTTVFTYFILTVGCLFFSQRLHPIPLPWASFFVFILLGTTVAMVSVVFFTQSIQLKHISVKLFVSFLCLVVGLKFIKTNLPKEIKL